ncbi:MAG: CBS domain-containing protein [Methanobacteriaceae archaeon]|nr:CBS domain-containing protein [Methanobacteriaceae archaeon]
MHVKDIMAKEVIVVDKDQNIHDALKLMKKHKISRLPVINTNQNHQKELVGIITEKDIAMRLGSSKYGNLAPSHFHVSTVMTPHPLTAEANQTLATAAETMLENGIGGLTVMESGNIIGMLTKSDFLDTCQGRPFTEITVKERMKTDITTVGPQDRLVHARRLIIDQDVGRLPVMENGELQGMITAKDIALAMMSFRKVVPDKYKPARIRNLLVEDVMVQNVKTITEEEPVSQAARIMLDENFSGLPVTGDEGMTGIITKTDFLKLIVELEKV